MRKIKLLILMLISVLGIILSIPAYANMAAPRDDDLASGVSFEKNNDLRVISEELDIKIKGETADIKAIYNMKNIKNVAISSQAMFISPNISGNSARVLMNGMELSFKAKSYYIDHNTSSRIEEWKFVIENPGEESEYLDMVDTISFNMEFKPLEEAMIIVSYSYRLGGYPSLDFDSKYGSLTYYLSPASMWEDYGGITINLELSSDMPVLEESSIKFEKVGKNKYQYKASSLPKEELKIRVNQNGWQKFISSFRSPYLMMNFVVILPLILVALVAIAIIAIIIVSVRRRKQKN